MSALGFFRSGVAMSRTASRNCVSRRDNFSSLPAHRRSTHLGSSAIRPRRLGGRAVVRDQSKSFVAELHAISPSVRRIRMPRVEHFASHQSTSFWTQGEAAASGDAISRKYSDSASAFSIVPQSDGVTANSVLSRKIRTDRRRYQGRAKRCNADCTAGARLPSAAWL